MLFMQSPMIQCLIQEVTTIMKTVVGRVKQFLVIMNNMF